MYDSDDEERKKKVWCRKIMTIFSLSLYSQGSQYKAKGGRESGGTWIKEDRGKPLDFLDSTAGQHLLGK